MVPVITGVAVVVVLDTLCMVVMVAKAEGAAELPKEEALV
jgi:hypothetical protein